MAKVFGISLSATAGILLTLFAMMPFLAGCSSSSDDDNGVVIEVCNSDDEAYRVELRRDADGTLVQDFDIGKWYNIGAVCDNFENIDPGTYYIVITEDGSENSDESDSFYLESGDDKYFRIESPGRISDTSGTSGRGRIEICNSDDEDYIVELRQDSDGKVVEELEIGKWYNFDQCDEFADILEGEYYIVIYEKDSNNSSESDTFYLSDGEVETFSIKSPGVIENN